MWHQKLVEELGKFGFEACKSDPALFMNKSDPNNVVYVLVYVDDLLIMGKEVSLISAVKDNLKGVFKIHDLGQVKNFLGCEVSIDQFSGSLKMTNVLKIENLAVEYGITHQVNDRDTHVYWFCAIRMCAVH
jgi:hypothetical protein